MNKLYLFISENTVPLQHEETVQLKSRMEIWTV